MPVRLLKDSYGQLANTLLWTSGAQEREALSLGVADTQIELASDFAPAGSRISSLASTPVITTATMYRLQLNGTQDVTLATSGFWKTSNRLIFVPEGTGTKTVTPATGVTINGVGTAFTIGAQWKPSVLICLAPNTWVGASLA